MLSSKQVDSYPPHFTPAPPSHQWTHQISPPLRPGAEELKLQIPQPRLAEQDSCPDLALAIPVGPGPPFTAKGPTGLVNKERALFPKRT